MNRCPHPCWLLVTNYHPVHNTLDRDVASPLSGGSFTPSALVARKAKSCRCLWSQRKTLCLHAHKDHSIPSRMLAKTIWYSYLECRVIFIRKLLVSVIRLWLIKRLKIQIRSVFLHHLFQCSRHTFKCGSFNWLVLPTIWYQLISEKTKVRFIV